MLEGIQERQNILLVLSHHSHNNFRTLLENAFLFENTESVHDVSGESERNDFRDFQLCTFFENAVEIHVSHLTCVLMNQDIVSVTITESNYVADDRPNRCCFNEIYAGFVPKVWTGEMLSEPRAKYWFNSGFYLRPAFLVCITFTKLNCQSFYV